MKGNVIGAYGFDTASLKLIKIFFNELFGKNESKHVVSAVG